MFKKIIAISTIFVFFACSGEDNYYGDLPGEGSGGFSSSSEESNGDLSSSSGEGSGGSSSSSEEAPSETLIVIAKLDNKASAMLGTYTYGYTLKASEKEDLTQFWNTSGELLDENGEPVLGEDGEPVTITCLTTSQPSRPDSRCEQNKENAILQNTITNQFSDLHYEVTNNRFIEEGGYVTKLDRYNLTEEGDQAAIGLNAGDGNDEGKSIGELQVSQLDGTTAFVYRGRGGAHVFRAASSDNSFWYYKVPATDEITDIRIPVSELKGMGSAEGTPFDISTVTKFLWVVEYDADVPGNNQGSLFVFNFRARVANAE